MVPISRAGLVVIPALSVASIGPEVFLAAIDFAGSYPVVLLWGLAPPLIALQLRRRARQKHQAALLAGSGEQPRGVIGSAGPDAWLGALSTLSLALVAMNVFSDFGWVLKPR